MRERNQTDILAGALFFVLGTSATLLAFGYKIGTASHMGPGYFPALLGGILGLLGCIIATRGFRQKNSSLSAGTWRGLFFVIGSVILFGLCLPHLGLVLTVVVVTVASSLASPRFSFPRAMATGGALATASYVIFLIGLRLPIPAWPTV